MSRSSPEGITLLLREWRGGSSEAEQELWPILYRELKTLARSVLRGQAGRRRLGTTTLVHEAYLRLLGPAASNLVWNDRGHFFAVAARAMRFVRALERLARINPRYEKLVELRYFGGLSVDETAEALGVSRPTVVRDWQAARTWLYGELHS